MVAEAGRYVTISTPEDAEAWHEQKMAISGIGACRQQRSWRQQAGGCSGRLPRCPTAASEQEDRRCKLLTPGRSINGRESTRVAANAALTRRSCGSRTAGCRMPWPCRRGCH
jgi:hypothetical protein